MANDTRPHPCAARLRRTAAARTSGVAALVAATLLASSCTGSAEPDETPVSDPTPTGPGVRSYVSTDVVAPELPVTLGPAASSDTSDDLYVLGPKKDEAVHVGPLLVDATGEPVWISPGRSAGYDVRVQELDGEPVLTYYEGRAPFVGNGQGSIVVLDTSYQEIARVTTGDPLEPDHADLHDSTITPDGTMLLTSYPIVPRDLSALGGPADGYVFDGVVQEVDVMTGDVVSTWSALDHVDLADTFATPEATDDAEATGTQDAPFDWFHVNSAKKLTPDGDVLVSGRNTHAVYALDRGTGEVRWTLGGRSSDVEMVGSGPDDEPGTGAQFAWQHDAQLHEDGTLTVFDNEGDPAVGDHSRGLRLALETDADGVPTTATVDQEWLPSDPTLVAGSQGNVQVLDDGDVVIGWGDAQVFGEYTADGELVREFPIEAGESYRAYRADWHATPSDPPAVVVEDGTAYVTWNGATDVASWRLVAGDDEASATEVATVPRDGFETALAPVPDDAEYVAVEALAADGAVLGTGTP
ncbi:arylsulfotransferase ASST [Sediminihabitans luteus]|uniref:Arylsulfotransferase ASST n=1 Tax=Sediminihabitans luteus TaxID=1138585 RepID=A0A2M9D0Y5_9CELL|nr:arylsulfotransferase family protein [Sediminihabitans luteus]PJJ77745.1 arylsulfotransferase ASST [Sediminihabitans luteus]